MFAALCYLPCCRSAAEGQDRPCRSPSFIHSTLEGSEDLHLVGTNHCADGGGMEHVASARSCSEDPLRHYRCDTTVAEEHNLAASWGAGRLPRERAFATGFPEWGRHRGEGLR